MLLYLNDTSPFARQVLITAIECGTIGIELKWIDPWESPTELIKKNPYSMVPVLVLDDGRSLYESNLICEYLINQSELDSKSILNTNYNSFDQLGIYALGKNLMDVSFRKVIFDRFHKGVSPISIRSDTAIQRALLELESFTLSEDVTKINSLSDICLSVALQYIEFRIPKLFSKLGKNTEQWIKSISRIESLKVTTPAKLGYKPEHISSLFEI
ncbi:hypothetical protein ACH42_11300 [Endozoicomonas sp. (ex Bugula neritina AB1)]|nr:hypothetical protein ACH42_11300 [Endozoicomonas sp. (ex Bugula neritina AB1)]